MTVTHPRLWQKCLSLSPVNSRELKSLVLRGSDEMAVSFGSHSHLPEQYQFALGIEFWSVLKACFELFCSFYLLIHGEFSGELVMISEDGAI